MNFSPLNTAVTIEIFICLFFQLLFEQSDFLSESFQFFIVQRNYDGVLKQQQENAYCQNQEQGRRRISYAEDIGNQPQNIGPERDDDHGS